MNRLQKKYIVAAFVVIYVALKIYVDRTPNTSDDHALDLLKSTILDLYLEK